MRPLAWLDRLDAIAPVFVEAAVRGSVVLLVALIASHLLRRRSAAARHLVWVGAIVVQLALPLFTLWGPRWDVAMPTAVASVLPLPSSASTGASTTPSTSAPSLPATDPQPAAPVSGAVQRTAAAPRTAESAQRARAEVAAPAPGLQPGGRGLLLIVWLAGTLFILVRLAVGTAIVATLARRGARVVDGGWLSLAQRLSGSLQIDRPLTLLRGDRVGVPITWGIVYPVVLLPDDADAWPEERRRFVLVHEMAHVKRLDALTQLAGQLALALFWFNPLVWMANRRMQLEREHACDDYVLRHGTSASQYAEELLAMVRSLGTPGRASAQPAFAALAMARRSEFEGRMLSILDPVLDRHPLSKGRTLMSALAALLLVVPLAALHPYERAATVEAPHVAPTATKQAPSLPSEPSLPSSPSLPTTPSSPSQPSRASLPSAPKGVTSAITALDSGLARTAAGLATVGSQLKPTTNPRSCDEPAVRGTTINRIHSNQDDDGRSAVKYMSLQENGDCTEATLVGRVTFTEEEDDIASMPVTAHAVFRERNTRVDRELVVRRADDGTIAHILRVDGRPAPYDDAARRWLAGFLPTVLREAAINVGPRVARLRAQGGVDAVLRAVGTIRSSGAKRAHYTALIDGDRLSSDDLEKVVRHAGRNLSSSGDLRAVLTRAGPGARNDGRTSGAFEEALRAVGSSGDKRAILEVYGQSTDRDMLRSVMKLTETVPSSGDRTALLKVLAPNYLSRNDDGLRDAFFRTLETIPSSGDKRSALTGSVMGFAAANERIAHAVAEAAAGVPSSGDRAAVLLALADAGALKSARVREAYLKATEGMSSGDASRVLRAAAVIDRY